MHVQLILTILQHCLNNLPEGFLIIFIKCSVCLFIQSGKEILISNGCFPVLGTLQSCLA